MWLQIKPSRYGFRIGPLSISQIKKHFEDMSSYLGRDATGIEKLRKLKEAVNVVRTKLSESEQSADLAVRQMEIAHAESIKAKRERDDSVKEVQRLNQVVNTLTRQLSEAWKQDSSDDLEIQASVSLKQKQYRSTIKRLRRVLPECPGARSFFPKSLSKERAYAREDFSKGWTYEDLWILGASTAILASFHGHVLITSNESPKDLEPLAEDANGTLMRKHLTLEWVKKQIRTDDTESLQLSCQSSLLG